MRELLTSQCKITRKKRGYPWKLWNTQNFKAFHHNITKPLSVLANTSANPQFILGIKEG